MNWKQWGIGALNAVLSGITGGGASMYAGLGWKQAAGVAGACAWMSFSKWIAQHPLPGADPAPASTTSAVKTWPQGGPQK